MKSRHDGDCSIYASLDNNIPEAGICTCGYGHERIWEGDYSQIYSYEMEEKLRSQRIDKSQLEQAIQKLKEDKETSENPQYLEKIIQILENE